MMLPLKLLALCFAGLTAFEISGSDAVQAASPDRPNVIFIMADDLGYAHLGCYGQKKIATPNLDQLASEGMRFTNFYAGNCVCAPSRSVLMTGFHGGHTAVRGNSGGIPLADEDVTVAEVLQAAGYRTGLFGKWGLGEHGTPGVPYRQGFDEFFGYLHQIHAHFYYPEYLWLGDQHYRLPGNDDGAREQYTHDEIVTKALDFVRRHQKDQFFMYVPFAVPHYELLVPQESLAQYEGKFPETPYVGREGRPTGYPHDYAQQAIPKAATAAIISHMDRSVGKLMALLKELDIDDNTIVFFTSDNGATPGASDPDFFNACGAFRGYKGSLWEGGLRVPLVVRWPDHVSAGATTDQVGTFADVLPTLAELAGVEPTSGIDGISIGPTLLGEDENAQPQHEYLYWEDDGGRAVRQGHWKAIRWKPKSEVQLYDLKTDPGEQHDLASSKPKITKRLTGFLQQAHTKPRPQIEPERPQGRKYQ